MRLLGKIDEIAVRDAVILANKRFTVASNSLTILAEYGIQSEQKPQIISLELIEWADLVLFPGSSLGTR
ncbi:hypothetical protein [Microseira wollei]|uniref:Uncharacterized protein n=1 Tax=Microseira wollei NIES-4236 TaxID=2530354 RepID=A0AAV3XEG2_9CYAN|nr:hypothetical protein [Microseira wollei]GET39853.1 hypothetical protein MiSe_46250 [Microseira wollei NIES-4236]